MARQVRLGLILFIVGVGLGVHLSKTAALQAVLILTAAIIVFNIVAYKSFGKIVLILPIIFIIGLLRVAFDNPPAELPSHFQASVVIESTPTTYGSLVTVRPDGTKQRVRVATDRYPEFALGDKVNIEVKKVYVPGSYIVGSIKYIGEKEYNPITQTLAGIKRLFINGLNKSLPEPHSTFVAGTIVGGSASLPQELREGFRSAGLSHILAASGYNFSLLLMFLAYFLRFFAVRWQTIIFILFIPIFAFIANFSAPVLRAAVMAGLASLAVLVGRISSAKTAVLWAAAILLLFDPSLLKSDLGWQLSFLATLGMVWLMPIFEKVFNSQNSRLEYFWAIIFTTISAQITTAPLIAQTFGTFSLVALHVNLLVVGFIPAIMITGIFASITAFVWPFLGQLIALPAWLASFYIFKISQIFTATSIAEVYVNYSTSAMWVTYLLMSLIILFLRKKLILHNHQKLKIKYAD